MITLLLVLIVAILLFGAAAVTSFFGAVLQRIILAILLLVVCFFSISHPYLLFSVAIFFVGVIVFVAVEDKNKKNIDRLYEERARLSAVEPRTESIESRLVELDRKLASSDRKVAKYLEQQEKKEAALAARLGVEKIGNEYRMKK